MQAAQKTWLQAIARGGHKSAAVASEAWHYQQALLVALRESAALYRWVEVGRLERHN